MCQMCDEYENELVRMGLIEDAKAFRDERRREEEMSRAQRQQEPDVVRAPDHRQGG